MAAARRTRVTGGILILMIVGVEVIGDFWPDTSWGVSCSLCKEDSETNNAFRDKMMQRPTAVTERIVDEAESEPRT